ncbi:MAG: hypothetical protein ACKPKO_21865, partial [Candidatus Fonsibacter sp.]
VKHAVLNYLTPLLLEKSVGGCAVGLAESFGMLVNERRSYGRSYRMKGHAYGLPMDSGGWYRWNKLCDIAQEAIPIEMVPEQRFNMPAVCALASIGDELKQRFRFAVLLFKPEQTR